MSSEFDHEFNERLSKINRRIQEKLRRFLIVTAVFILVMLTIGVVTFGYSGFRFIDPTEQRMNTLQAQLLALREESQKLKDTTKVTEQTLADLLGKAIGFTKLSPADRQLLNAITERQKDLNARLKNLEDAISADPVKALSVPLVRKDLDALQINVNNNATTINAEVSRLYTFLLGFLGLLISVAVGFLGMSYSGLKEMRQRKDKPEEPKSPQ